MKNENGYTSVELVVAISLVFAAIITVSLCGASIYAAAHFLSKVW